MNKLYNNEVKKMLPVLQAVSEDRVIQAKGKDGLWHDIDAEADGLYIEILVNNPQNYRIKPSPTYRPFANAEECWNEMLKHQPFGWVKTKENKYRTIEVVTSRLQVATQEAAYSFKDAFDTYTFADGSAFGVKVEED